MATGDGLVQFVARLQPGERNGGLHWAARRSAEDGTLDDLAPRLLSAAVGAGLPESECRRTIAAAARDGGSMSSTRTRPPGDASRRATHSNLGNPEAAIERIMRGTRPAARTPVAAYLAARGLDVPIPDSLRYHPALLHKPSGREFAAMVAEVARWPEARVIAVHRTYLDPDGTGKARVEPQRMMLGPVAGGAVRLAPPSETMVVAEGIETAVSVQQATGIAAWAALSAVGIERLILPDQPFASTVIIAADNDATGLRHAHRAAERWIAEGRRVRIATPPAGFNDFNDVLRAEVHA